MSLFIDTSAILAILDADDQYHSCGQSGLAGNPLITGRISLPRIISLFETFALIQHRFGLEAVMVFQEDIVRSLVWNG